MNLLFEKSVPGRACTLLPDCDVPNAALPEQFARKQPLTCRSSPRRTSAATIQSFPNGSTG